MNLKENLEHTKIKRFKISSIRFVFWAICLISLGLLIFTKISTYSVDDENEKSLKDSLIIFSSMIKLDSIKQIQLDSLLKALANQQNEQELQNQQLREEVLNSIEWAKIPAGKFTMGSSLHEKSRKGDEKQFQVILSAYKMSKHEITFDQYFKFCQATGRNKPDANDIKSVKIPVYNVSWEDAKAFAIWINTDLPSEAQWEYACRAGTITPFYTGSSINTNQANYNGYYPYNNGKEGMYLGVASEVGSYTANIFGLFDMLGNLWEWCEDKHDLYPESLQHNPKQLDKGNHRIVRGGSYLSPAKDCRCAARQSFNPNYKSGSIGFRVVFIY